MSEPILTVDDLVVRFPVRGGLLKRTVGHVHAVDGVSFTLARGETLGIVGESGCGKSTTGLAIMGLIETSSGTVRFEGQDVRSADRARRQQLRRAMQIVFQDPYSSLNPRMTIGAAIAAPMRIHKLGTRAEIRDRVADLLEQVGLQPDHASRYPHEFSGGQRQRVGIARALAVGPRLLIGDEPVSALDVSIQAQIVNLLVELQKKLGLSCIFISHDLAVVEHICDRIAVMYLGQIVELASYRDLYATPRHPYTQALLAAIPRRDAPAGTARQALAGEVPSPLSPPPGCRFQARCPFRMDRCAVEAPALRDVGEQKVACHLYP